MSRKRKGDTIRTGNGQVVSDLRNDIAYLVEEINALKNFMDFIPFTEKPAEGTSILDLFREIDDLQCALYRAVAQVYETGDPLSIESTSRDDPVAVLDRIVFNREQMVKLLDTIPEPEWDKSIEAGSEKASMMTLLKGMVMEERQILKRISEQVMAMKS